MKSTGIVRKVDDLGRIVIPKELRKTLNIDIGAALEIFQDVDTVVFKKYNPGCCLCDNVDQVVLFKGNYLCRECIAGIRDLPK